MKGSAQYAIVVILLLAIVGMFAYSQGYLGDLGLTIQPGSLPGVPTDCNLPSAPNLCVLM